MQKFKREIWKLHDDGMTGEFDEASIGKTYLFIPTAKDIWQAVKEMYFDAEDSS